jgi:hypothetical protein
MHINSIESEFLRIPPRDGRCPISGLSRSSIEAICVPSKKNGFNPPVRAKLLRKPEAMRGAWLIPRKAFLDYLNSLPESKD